MTVRQRIGLRELALAVAAATASLGVGAVAQDGFSVYPTGADVERGRAIAVGAYNRGPGGACFQCHGMDGKGDAGAGFPRLTGQVYKYLYDALEDYASGLRQNPVMTPIAKQLSREDMRDVSAFYALQSEAEYGPRPNVDPGRLQMGGGIAALGNAKTGIQGCINCHGPEGTGLAPTYPYLAGQYAIYLAAQLRAWKTGERKGDRLSAVVMQDIAKRMTDEEIEAVSAYYASIRPQRMPIRTVVPLPVPGATVRELRR